MLKKISPRTKKIFSVVMSMLCLASVFVVGCFAEGEVTTAMSPETAASTVFGQITSQLNFTTILAVLGVAIGASLGISLGWWAIRKVYGMVMKAFSKGKAGV